MYRNIILVLTLHVICNHVIFVTKTEAVSLSTLTSLKTADPPAAPAGSTPRATPNVVNNLLKDVLSRTPAGPLHSSAPSPVPSPNAGLPSEVMHTSSSNTSVPESLAHHAAVLHDAPTADIKYLVRDKACVAVGGRCMETSQCFQQHGRTVKQHASLCGGPVARQCCFLNGTHSAMHHVGPDNAVNGTAPATASPLKSLPKALLQPRYISMGALSDVQEKQLKDLKTKQAADRAAADAEKHTPLPHIRSPSKPAKRP
jgi:hypothetical protein